MDYTDTNLMAGILVFLASFATAAIIISAIIGIITLIANIKIFQKAGQPGWKVIIPFYNVYTCFKMFWSTSKFWILLIAGAVFGFLSSYDNLVCQLISLAAIIVILVLQIKYCGKMAKSFGKGKGFAAGLFFLPTLFTLILAFGKAQYVGNPCCTEAPVEVEAPAEIKE